MKRAFKGLRLKTGPEDRYDAVIIGAGVGGLICGNLLAKSGLKVLLVEQHYMVGGYCSTFKRKGYTFDASSHFYPLLGNETSITGKLLKDLEVPTEWIKMDPVDLFHFPDGSRFSVPSDFDTYLHQVKRDFPGEVDAIDAFFAEVREAYMYGLLHYFRRRRVDRIKAYKDLTVTQVLDKHFKDRKLKLLLTADSPHWGLPPERTSFVFDSMLRLSYFLGNYYPVGGSQVFSDDLAMRFEEQGGQILMNTMVNRIITEDGAVTGIEVETGSFRNRYTRTVHAEVIVSNADLIQTSETLLGKEILGEAYLDSLRKLRPTFPCYLMHIGLEGVDNSVLEEAQGYYWNSWDTSLMGRDGLKFKIFAPTLLEPSMAPQGCHAIVIQKILDMSYRTVSTWSDHKNSVDDYIMENLEGVIPGITDQITVRLSASAQTAFRFTRNTQGAMLGWEASPDQLGDKRPDIYGPLKNLFYTGHWVQPGGGITPVIVSAMQVADAITSGKHRAAPDSPPR